LHFTLVTAIKSWSNWTFSYFHRLDKFIYFNILF